MIISADKVRAVSNTLERIEDEISNAILEAAKKGLKEVKISYKSYESKINLIKESLKKAGYKYEEDTWYDSSIDIPVPTKKLIISW